MEFVCTAKGDTTSSQFSRHPAGIIAGHYRFSSPYGYRGNSGGSHRIYMNIDYLYS